MALGLIDQTRRETNTIFFLLKNFGALSLSIIQDKTKFIFLKMNNELSLKKITFF